MEAFRSTPIPILILPARRLSHAIERHELGHSELPHTHHPCESHERLAQSPHAGLADRALAAPSYWASDERGPD